MVDIADSAVLVMRCPSCGLEYEVPLSRVLVSQALLNEGCSARGESECPPLFLAGLVPRESIEALRDAWQRAEADAAKVGARLVVRPSAGA
jgi:hypothetical protein